MLETLLALLLSATEAENSTNDDKTDQIIVTASKKKQTAQNLSTAVSVISKEEIENKNITLLPDLLRDEAGVYIQQTTPGQGIPILRGLKGSENVHLVDGMRLNTAFFRNSPNQYMALIDPFMMEQIEVIRGPASVLYGGDALGGVVNIITHTPEFFAEDWQNQGKIFVSYDSADEKTLSHLSWDGGNEKIATTVGLSYQNVGFREPGGTDQEIPFTAYISKAFNNKWVFNINEENKVKLSYQYLNQPATPRVDDLIPGFGQKEPDSSLFLFKPNERQFAHLSWSNSNANTVYDNAEFNLSWQRIKDHRVRQRFGSSSLDTEQNESSLYSLQSSFNKQFNAHNDIVYGLDFYNDTISSARQRESNGSVEIRDPRFPDQSKMRHVGLFADWTHYMQNQDLIFGLRYSDYNVDLNNNSVTNDELNLDDLTWHLGWLRHVNEQNKLYSNLGRGFRPPNIFDLGQVGERPGNRFNIVNTDVKPETVHTLDFGWRHFSASWDADIAVFYSKYNDKIASVETGDLTDSGQIIVQSQNLNDVTLYGLESSFNYYLSADSEFRAVINYTWGEEESDSGVEPADRIPPLNGSISYEKTFESQWSINPKIIFSDTQDRLSGRDSRDPRINPNGTGGFTTYNFYAKYPLTDKSKVRLGIENIFDKKYREHGSGLEAAGRNLHISYSQKF